MFYLQRKSGTWRSVDSVHGSGTSLSPRTYVLQDPGVPSLGATYRIKEVDLDGSEHFSESVSLPASGVTDAGVREFTLGQNYPNPFNPVTTIRYGLPVPSHVTVTLFNVLGEHIRTLVDDDRDAGFHDVTFDGTGFASGVYFYTLRAGGFVQTKRLSLLR
jgi:hypothetical protein